MCGLGDESKNTQRGLTAREYRSPPPSGGPPGPQKKTSSFAVDWFIWSKSCGRLAIFPLVSLAEAKQNILPMESRAAIVFLSDCEDYEAFGRRTPWQSCDPGAEGSSV
jgi:hypothetical protein